MFSAHDAGDEDLQTDADEDDAAEDGGFAGEFGAELFADGKADFTISEYGWFMALVCSLIVAAVTFFICEVGLAIGKKFGTKLSGKASVLGGVILIGIGLEIFISGMMG